MTAKSYWIELMEKSPVSSKITCNSNIYNLDDYFFSWKKGEAKVFFHSKEIISTNGYDFLKIDDIEFRRNNGVIFRQLASDCASIKFGESIGLNKFFPMIDQREIYFNDEVYLVSNFLKYNLIGMSKTRIEFDKETNYLHVLLGCLVYSWADNRNDRVG